MNYPCEKVKVVLLVTDQENNPKEDLKHRKSGRVSNLFNTKVISRTVANFVTEHKANISSI